LWKYDTSQSTSSTTEEEINSEFSNTPVIIGVVVGIVALLLLAGIAVAIYVVIKKRQTNKGNRAPEEAEPKPRVEHPPQGEALARKSNMIPNLSDVQILQRIGEGDQKKRKKNPSCGFVLLMLFLFFFEHQTGNFGEVWTGDCISHSLCFPSFLPDCPFSFSS
jgi:hypothetical protein